MGKKIIVPLQAAALSAALVWADQQRTAGIAEEARAKFTVSTAVTGNSRVADTAATTTMTVTVTTKFDGVNVDCDATPSGWTRTATGAYTKTLANAASGSIAAQPFTYTPPASSPYAGIVCTKSSEAKSIVVTYPAWYGFVASTDASPGNIIQIIASLTRRTSKLTQTADLTNGLETAGYYWILTHSTASATQSGNNILRAVVSGREFPSPNDIGITLTGYNLYISTNSASAGGKFGDVALTINV
jgi:hypothetical protein